MATRGEIAPAISGEELLRAARHYSQRDSHLAYLYRAAALKALSDPSDLGPSIQDSYRLTVEEIREYMDGLSLEDAWRYEHHLSQHSPRADRRFVEYAATRHRLRKDVAWQKVEEFRAHRSAVGEMQFRSISEIEDTTEPILFLVPDLLMRGGSTILVAAPKQGKSTLAKQIAVAVAQGESIFGHETHQGEVLYLQLEEHEGWTASTLRRMGLKDGDPLSIAFGAPDPSNVVETLRAKLREHPSTVLLVLDMLAGAVGIQDFNDYGEVRSKIQPLTDLAHESGTSILILHHSKKSATGNPLEDSLGTIGISGSVDIVAGMHNSIVANRPITRLTAKGRGVHLSLQLVFDPERESYNTIGDAAVPESVMKVVNFKAQKRHHGGRLRTDYVRRIWENNYKGTRKHFQEDWAENPLLFYDYVDRVLGPRPKKASLNCINNDLGYVADNLEWADAREQARNRRRKNSSIGR